MHENQGKLMKIKAIFGLGNPGKEYENTYHNLGALFIRHLVEEQGLVENLKGINKKARYHKAKIGGKEIILLEPSESNIYMNELGGYIRKTAKKLNIVPEEILVVHDDSDLALGKFKHSYESSSAGHKGVQSIINAFGTNRFHRIRIGIRKKPGKALGFVLKNMSKAEGEIMNKLFEEVKIYLEQNIQ